MKDNSMKGFCFEKSGVLSNRPERVAQARGGWTIVIYALIFLGAMLRFAVPSFPPHHGFRVFLLFLFVGFLMAIGFFLINGVVLMISKKDGILLQKWGSFVTFWSATTPLVKVKAVLLEKYILERGRSFSKKRTVYDISLKVGEAKSIALLVMQPDFEEAIAFARTVADYLGLQVEESSREAEKGEVPN